MERQFCMLGSWTWMERHCRDRGNFLSALSETWTFLHSTVGMDFSLFPLIPKKIPKFWKYEKKDKEHSHNFFQNIRIATSNIKLITQ